MIELGAILLTDDTMASITGEKIRNLSTALNFSEFTAVRLASISCELARRIINETDRGSLSVSIQVPDNTTQETEVPCILKFVFRTKTNTVSLDNISDFFDQFETSRSSSGFLNLHLGHFFFDHGFSMDQPFIKQASQIISQVSKAELFREIQQKNKILSMVLEKLKDKNIALKKASQHKSAFVASMSHEIRTPMNAILGYIQIMMHDAALTPGQKNHLTIMKNSSKHLIRLINEILEISKIETGKTALLYKTFDLKELVEDVLALFNNNAWEKGLMLILEMEDCDSIIIRQDEAKIKQVLINLLGNAFKFTAKGHIRLKVKIMPAGKCSDHTKSNINELFVTCEVSDTGCGIKKEEQQLVFDAFEQADINRSKEGGSGLGLSISRHYAQLMGGDLVLKKSVVDKGSTFVMTFKANTADEKDIEQSESSFKAIETLKPGQPDYHILIIDDLQVNLDLMTFMLKRVGFHVHHADSGEKALEMVPTLSLDAVFMDIVMPSMNGVETTKKIKALSGYADLPVIALSASALSKYQEQALAAGCYAFIKKPIDENELLHVLGQALNLKYVYKKDPVKKKNSSVKLNKPDDFKILAEELRKNINKAAELGDILELKKMAAQASSTDSKITEALNELIDKFDLATLKKI